MKEKSPAQIIEEINLSLEKMKAIHDRLKAIKESLARKESRNNFILYRVIFPLGAVGGGGLLWTIVNIFLKS